jgi:hypothetical protein
VSDAIVTQSAVTVGAKTTITGGLNTPYSQTKQLRGCSTAGNCRLVKRPYTAYKASASQRATILSNYGAFRNYTSNDPYQE